MTAAGWRRLPICARLSEYRTGSVHLETEDLIRSFGCEGILALGKTFVHFKLVEVVGREAFHFEEDRPRVVLFLLFVEADCSLPFLALQLIQLKFLHV